MSERTLSPDSPELVWQMYQGLAGQCQHFNGLESTYRTLASTWLLAAFGATGYVLNEKVGSSPAMLVAGIGAAGAIGIVLLWVLDLQVYHRLLAAAFSEQIRLEKEYSWLPMAAHLMKEAHHGAGVVPKIAWFYVAAYLLLIGVASLAIGSSLTDAGLAARVFAGVTLFVLAGAPVVLRMHHSARAPLPDTDAYDAGRPRRGMKWAHKELGINEVDWKIAVDLFTAALVKHHVTPQAQSELLQMIENMKSKIVEVPD
jgi:hypothetical protein